MTSPSQIAPRLVFFWTEPVLAECALAQEGRFQLVMSALRSPVDPPSRPLVQHQSSRVGHTMARLAHFKWENKDGGAMGGGSRVCYPRDAGGSRGRPASFPQGVAPAATGATFISSSCINRQNPQSEALSRIPGADDHGEGPDTTIPVLGVNLLC